jgi:hypothetical protein
MPPLLQQTGWLLLLSIPVACIAWTVTHEEVFREPRDFAQRQVDSAGSYVRRKFFYLFTCEYCFSHYVAAFFVAITGYKLLLPNFWGYVIAWFSLVWVANQYMSVFGRLRQDLKGAKLENKITQIEVEQKKKELEPEEQMKAA